jgi:hypothetical protein
VLGKNHPSIVLSMNNPGVGVRLTRLPRRYCDVVGKEYLLRGDKAVYMDFFDWIAEPSRQKGQQKSQRTYKNYWM